MSYCIVDSNAKSQGLPFFKTADHLLTHWHSIDSSRMIWVLSYVLHAALLHATCARSPLCVWERERERERETLLVSAYACVQGTVFQQWVCTGYCLWRPSGTSGCFLSLHWLLYCSSVTLTLAHSVFFQAVTWNSFLLKSPMSRNTTSF